MELDTVTDSDWTPINEKPLNSGSEDDDYDDDIMSETTLFSKLLITKNKSNESLQKKKTKKQSIAECRIEKDLKEINKSQWKSFGANTTISLNESNLLNFSFTINPIEGYYRNGTFPFNVWMDRNYPYSSPKILSKNSIFHPNIDADSKRIGLNILNKDNWSPVLTLNDIIYAIQLLFFEPHCNNNYIPTRNYMFNQRKGNKYKYITNNSNYSSYCQESIILNKNAANLYLTNKQQFDYTVQRIINGCNMYQREWQCCSRDNNNNNNHNNVYHWNYNQTLKQHKISDNIYVNQVITKKSKLLGNRKRNFSEMTLELNYKNNRGHIDRFIDDETVFNPSATPKKQKINHQNRNGICFDMDFLNQFNRNNKQKNNNNNNHNDDDDDDDDDNVEDDDIDIDDIGY